MPLDPTSVTRKNAPAPDAAFRMTSVASMQDRSSLFLVLNTVVLASLAVAAFAAASSEKFESSSVIWLTIQFAAMWGGVWPFWRSAQCRGEPEIVPALLMLLALGPFGWEVFSRLILDEGRPFEFLAMALIRNLVIGLAMVSVWRRYQRLCLFLSLFLMIFAAVTSRDIAIQILAGFYFVGAVGWLTISHWENILQRLHGRQVTPWPRTMWVLPILALLVAGLMLSVAGEHHVPRALSGWLPSSGGEGQSDPFARNGVGDGDRLIAGSERIQSFGPVEDAPFIEDHQPSLYDVFNDTYDEPVKPKQADRSVALAADKIKLSAEHIHTQTERPEQAFSTLRQSRSAETRQRADDLRSDALFYVAGRVPLHLRLQLYDQFDGTDWSPQKNVAHPPPLSLVSISGKPWIKLPDHLYSCEFLGSAETHALKIINLDTAVIPAPITLHGVHVDLVDQLDFFCPGPEGLIAMDRERLPALVPIHIASRSLNESKLQSEKFSLSPTTAPVPLSSLPEQIDRERIHELAEQWSRGHSAGWSTIQAIIQRLRSEYQHDRDAPPPPEGILPVEHFLFESKRGPDYLFATSAALLLRSLGYSTRIVSGFYVDPEKYDAKSRHTAVLKEDVHFWVEVRATGGIWITAEPTPGYEVLGPPLGILAQVWNAVVMFAYWILEHTLLVLSLIGISVLGFRRRAVIADTLESAVWRFAPGRDSTQVILQTWRLLQSRARRAGCPRPAGVTVRSWLQHLSRGQTSDFAERLLRVANDLDDAAYSPPGSERLLPREEAIQLCRSVLDRYTLNWFRDLVKNEPASSVSTGNEGLLLRRKTSVASPSASLSSNRTFLPLSTQTSSAP